MDNHVTPTNETNRLQWIDGARGFAIFGIFIVNVGAFAAPYFLYGGEKEAWNSTLDHFIQAFIDIFFQASFYTLFSLLFGFGIQMMVDRLQKRDIEVYPLLTRRLLLLIGFGSIHAFVIWHGDILLAYGLIGLLLLLFLSVKDETLLGWGILLLGGSVSLFSLALYVVRDNLGGYDEFAVEQALQNYQSSNLLAIWSQNYNDWMYANGGIGILVLAATLLPLFLFGMYIARKRLLHEPGKHRAIIIRIWILSFVVFIGIKMVPYLFGNPLWFSYIQDNIGGTASALFYITSITLLAQKNLGLKLIQPFIYVGRMAFTNYILQSIMSYFLFYGIGLGLYGSIRPFSGIVIVFIIFGFQVPFSKWWLSRFLFGPLEWLWRSLTYKQKQPFRKNEGKRG